MPRNHDIITQFKSGLTMQKVGDLHGISRERVRQILKAHSVSTSEGGRHKQDGHVRHKLRQLGRDMLAQGIRSRERTPTRAFAVQRQNARMRGIVWELTIEEWWGVWEASGKWPERGRGNGYVMSRKGDKGPYSINNVYIQSAKKNNSEQGNRYVSRRLQVA